MILVTLVSHSDIEWSCVVETTYRLSMYLESLIGPWSSDDFVWLCELECHWIHHIEETRWSDLKVDIWWQGISIGECGRVDHSPVDQVSILVEVQHLPWIVKSYVLLGCTADGSPYSINVSSVLHLCNLHLV